jgi:Tfp pilus assembly protein PilN
MSSLIADAWRRARRRRRRYALAGLIVLAVTAAFVTGLTRHGPSQRTPDTHRAAAIQQRREAIVRQELAARAQALAARREAQAMAARLHRITKQEGRR